MLQRALSVSFTLFLGAVARATSFNFAEAASADSALDSDGGLYLLQHRASALGGVESSVPKAVFKDDPSHPSIFIAVFSRRDSAERRGKIRDMWGNASAAPGLVTAKFALCFEEDGLAPALQKENAAHNDLMVMNCEEGYDRGRLTRKVLASMKVYHNHFNDHRLFFKVDDDAFVAWPRLAKFLVQYGGLNSYMGIPVGEARVCRNESYLWYEPYDNWPFDMFPKGMAGGSGYILGRLLVGLILGTGLGEANVLYNEDRSTAVWIKRLMESGAPVVWKEIPGIDGWWNWDYLHPKNNWMTWGDYKGILHHGLEAETIACLGRAAMVDDPKADISWCFQTEVGKTHEPLVCAQLPAKDKTWDSLSEVVRGSRFIELTPEV